eukprot:jgi/Tetstr1/440010/TSEL_028371.t1
MRSWLARQSRRSRRLAGLRRLGTMPVASATYFSSVLCTSFVTACFSVAFLIVGVQHKDACCEKPLANWNIACGAIGIIIAAKKLAKDIGEVPTKGPDGSDLSEAQQEAVAKMMREHQESQARMAAMYDGPVGKLFGFTQSCQSCYIMIMVIIGAVFVWTTFPSDECELGLEPKGCEPFLWHWTQGWVITNLVLWALTCCCLCCGVFAVATMKAADPEGMSAQV